MVQGILSTEVDKWWEHVEIYIERALEYGLGEYKPEDIKALCMSKDMQLWIMWDRGVKGAFVTQILKYPQFSILLGLLISANDFKEWRNEVYYRDLVKNTIVNIWNSLVEKVGVITSKILIIKNK